MVERGRKVTERDIRGLSARADEADLDRAALWQEIHQMRSILVAAAAAFMTVGAVEGLMPPS